MSTDKIDPSKKDTTISPNEDLVKTKSGDVELSEEELKRVSGGLTVQLTDTLITQVPQSGHGGGTTVPDK